MNMRTTILSILCLLLAVNVSAQDWKKFSPEKFDADMEAYVSKEAGLTQQEADKFFPLFREMHQKQRAVYGKMRHMGMQKPADEEGCAKAIKDADRMNVELRQIEQTYHKKMLQVVPASKVWDAIGAESRFHRRMMKGWQMHNGWQKGFGNSWQKPNGQFNGQQKGKHH